MKLIIGLFLAFSAYLALEPSLSAVTPARRMAAAGIALLMLLAVRFALRRMFRRPAAAQAGQRGRSARR